MRLRRERPTAAGGSLGRFLPRNRWVATAGESRSVQRRAGVVRPAHSTTQRSARSGDRRPSSIGSDLGLGSPVQSVSDQSQRHHDGHRQHRRLGTGDKSKVLIHAAARLMDRVVELSPRQVIQR